MLVVLCRHFMAWHTPRVARMDRPFLCRFNHHIINRVSPKFVRTYFFTGLLRDYGNFTYHKGDNSRQKNFAARLYAVLKADK